MKEFKEKVLSEILSAPLEGEKGLAFLSALTRQNGSIHIKNRRANVEIALSSAAESFFAANILKTLYPAEFEILTEHIKSGPKKGGIKYAVQIPSGYTSGFLADTHITPHADNESASDAFDFAVPAAYLRNLQSAAAYIKGLIVASGEIYVPSMSEEGKAGYHFEISFEDQDKAKEALPVFIAAGCAPKINERGERFIIYLKDKDEILGLLATLSLAESVLTLKSIMDERAARGSINRMAICDAANMDKTFVAASNQLLAIGRIEESRGLDSLPPALRETASARMEYPQASMQELAEILGVTKSCLNHRLRKLLELGEEG